VVNLAFALCNISLLSDIDNFLKEGICLGEKNITIASLDLIVVSKPS